MVWTVEFHPLFFEEFEALSEVVRESLLKEVLLLEEFGPQLGRPTVDTLSNSKHSNMKELRFNADGGVWRTVFAFDPTRKVSY